MGRLWRETWAAWGAPSRCPCTVRTSESGSFGFSRNTSFVESRCLFGTEVLQSFFSAGSRFGLSVMTPLLGTKNLIRARRGYVPAGDGRAARSLLSCALRRGMGRLWRGMGGMGRPEPLSVHRPHQQQGLSRFSRNTRHETRITAFSSHGFVESLPLGTEALQSFFSAGSRFRSRVMTPLLGTKTSSAPVGDTCRLGTEEPPDRCFPARCGAAWGGYGAAWAAWGAPSRCPRTVRTSNRAFRGFPRDTKHESRLFRDTALSNRCLLVLKPFSLFFRRGPV